MSKISRLHRHIRLCIYRRIHRPAKHLRMRRRLIPFVVAGVAGLAGSLPVTFGWVAEERANQYTALYVALVYFFVSILFYSMRRRMKQDGRKLTVFGFALVDFFTGLILLSIVFTVVWSIIFYYATQHLEQPFWMRMMNRSAIGMAGTLIVGTGMAVGWEMRHARGRLLVHEDSDKVESIRYRPSITRHSPRTKSDKS